MNGVWVEERGRGWLVHFGDGSHGLLFLKLVDAKATAAEWAIRHQPSEMAVVHADGRTDKVAFRDQRASA